MTTNRCLSLSVWLGIASLLGNTGTIGLLSITLAQTAPSNSVEDPTVGTTVIQNFFGLPIALKPCLLSQHASQNYPL